MNYFLSSYSKYVINNIFWITGPARSGTSLLGKLLSTLKNIEYFYEPELIFSLLPMIKNISKKKWQLIYETYLSEELFFNKVTGRKLNFRKKDFSYIKNSIENNKLQKILTQELNRKSLTKYLKKNKHVVMIKAPDIIKNISEITNFYPRNKLIICNRNSADVTFSLIQKNWFDKKNIKDSTFPLLIKNHEYFPFWLPEKFHSKWKGYNANERCIFYVILTKKMIKSIKPSFTFNFEELIKNPNIVLNKFCKKFNFNKTFKTKEVISSIKNKKTSNLSDLKKLNIRNSLINELNNIDKSH